MATAEYWPQVQPSPTWAHVANEMKEIRESLARLEAVLEEYRPLLDKAKAAAERTGRFRRG